MLTTYIIVRAFSSEGIPESPEYFEVTSPSPFDSYDVDHHDDMVERRTAQLEAEGYTVLDYASSRDEAEALAYEYEIG